MDRIKFKINEKPYTVGCEVTSEVTLLDFLRHNAQLVGTKHMCGEGGCGACVVNASRPGAPAGAVNSCLVSITSCHDWEITTIEQVGNKRIGYHPIQKTLAKMNGTQCGYCSPGWVMSMYSLLQSKKNLTVAEIEQSFGSNICRCTGYRPILDAFKQFASDAPKPNRLLDIEDLYICKKTGESCDKSGCTDSDWCMINKEEIEIRDIELELKDGKLWFKVQTVDDIFHVLGMHGDDSYMLVAGNTAKGVKPIEEYPNVLIDISGVTELKGYHFDQNLILGAGSTLTETIDIFQQLAKTEDGFWYLDKLQEHISFVAHIPVRNLGTLAGNLMIKHKDNSFQSDIFLILEVVGALITVLDTYGRKVVVSPEAFLRIDMKGKVIVSILLPPLSHEYKLATYKNMPRAQSAHATVNAGFLYKTSPSHNTVSEARIVFGGISDKFVHAVATERFLIGKDLFTNGTLQGALKVLDGEVIVKYGALSPSVKYRKDIALGLFYKCLLQLCPENLVHPRYLSGGTSLAQLRPVSSGKQVFDTNSNLWPLNKPVEKVEALIQCSGEIAYTDDLPKFPHELFGVFVLSTVGVGDIVSIDPTTALNQPGVEGFYSAKDIPGVNSFVIAGSVFFPTDEEVFCNGSVKYHNQIVGLIVAETKYIAEKAAKLVHIKYTNVKKPVLAVRDAKEDTSRSTLFKEIAATADKGTDIHKVINGQMTIFSQFHFCMEALVCVAKPTEEGLEVHSTTQYMDSDQVAVSRALKIPEHKIDIHCRRLGGAYGLKISRASQLSVACSLAALKLNRPCRIKLPITTAMKAIGKRLPCAVDYEVAVDSTGKVQYVNESIYHDNGYIVDELIVLFALDVYFNCYDKSKWTSKFYNVTTDTTSNTWCRAPGTLEVIAAAEYMMERISYELSLDPLEVRLNNLASDYSSEIKAMVDRLKTDGEYDKRRAAVDKYNAENRWKKRGLRTTLLRWVPLGSQVLDVTMSVYHDDGSIAIVHSGIEMGQGVNTKAVQICSYFLKVPMEKIVIKGNNTIIAPNGFASAASLTSINVGVGVQRCCEILLERLEPYRTKAKDSSWEALVKTAFLDDVDMQVHAFVNKKDAQTADVFGATLAEVEIDVLTGEWEMVRVDVLQDVGQSVSPEIDIGQVEGAFIMGVGYWTCEHLIYDNQTGELLTDRTWDYHVPQARDIPQDFRIYFSKNSYSEARILGSKSIGEPPQCMSIVVPLALREAIVAARLEAGLPKNKWFDIDGPYTREVIQQATSTNYNEFKFR